MRLGIFLLRSVLHESRSLMCHSIVWGFFCTFQKKHSTDISLVFFLFWLKTKTGNVYVYLLLFCVWFYQKCVYCTLLSFYFNWSWIVTHRTVLKQYINIRYSVCLSTKSIELIYYDVIDKYFFFSTGQLYFIDIAFSRNVAFVHTFCKWNRSIYSKRTSMRNHEMNDSIVYF